MDDHVGAGGGFGARNRIGILRRNVYLTTACTACNRFFEHTNDSPTVCHLASPITILVVPTVHHQ